MSDSNATNRNDSNELKTYEDAPLIGENKRMPAIPGNRDDYLIDYMGADDKEYPLNWPFMQRIVQLCLAASTAFAASFGSAIIGGGTLGIMETFHVGTVVAAFNVSLYVLGFSLGPIVWGPMSELTGRRPPLVISAFGYLFFSFAAATAKDYQTLVLSRFFMGCFGAGSITVGPALCADLFDNYERGKVVSVVSLMIVVGPTLAPVVGGYIGFSYLGWRWTQYITGILAALVVTLLTFFLKETYPPKVLTMRAAKLRKETGNWALASPLETTEADAREIFENTVSKPMVMLVVEPILLLITLYMGLVYGILYLCLEAVPMIFLNYGWKGGNIFLPYLGMLVGMIIAAFTNLYIFDPIFVRRLKATKKLLLPEERLPPSMAGGLSFTIGIFLLCWTGNYKVHWIAPTIGLAFVGYGSMGIFLGGLNYIIDSYVLIAASAIAANTFLRSGFGCAFPLFARIMFNNLGIEWAGTLLGCLSALLVPVPFLFYKYGERIRVKSKFATSLEAKEEANQNSERAPLSDASSVSSGLADGTV